MENKQDFLSWLVDVRRDLHQHPEISNGELRTTEVIARILNELNIEVQQFANMTGAVGLIKGHADGPTIGLRADIDALPIQELNDVSYKSQNEGIMHACGHDAHTTIMLGVAKKIMDKDLPLQLKGNVKFFFQPAEERVAGAKAMISEGVLENPYVDRVIAGHMAPDLPVGKVGIFKGQGYASADRFVLNIIGKGTHGGRPNEGIDPIVAGAFFVTQIQSIIGRNIKPTDTAVISVGKFSAGNVSNVIPESANLEGTIRALSMETRRFVIQRLKEVVTGLETMFGVKCDFEIREGVPPGVNDGQISAFLYEISVEILGAGNVEYLPPVTGAEDFAYFAMERPSAIMRLGCANRQKGIVHPLHSPYFEIDETVLEIGVRIFVRAVEQFLVA